jgi:hypothetical protein
LNQQEPHTYPQGGVERNAKRSDDSSPRKIGLRSKEEIGLDEEMSKSAIFPNFRYNWSIIAKPKMLA